MFIVDNFRIILLVGLICSGGVPPTTALICSLWFGEETCAPGQVCARQAVRVGCKNPSDCPIEKCKDFSCVRDGTFGSKCCCNTDYCNSLDPGNKYGQDICSAPGVDRHVSSKSECAEWYPEDWHITPPTHPIETGEGDIVDTRLSPPWCHLALIQPRYDAHRVQSTQPCTIHQAR